MKKRFGFTLAEVLITLGIIGVVAAMTIPSLIQNTASVRNSSQFRKTLATLTNAVEMAQAHFGIGNISELNEACAAGNAANGRLEVDGLARPLVHQNSICGLFNSTLSGVRYVGLATNAAGGAYDGSTAPDAQAAGTNAAPANFLVYALPDGSFIGVHPDRKDGNGVAANACRMRAGIANQDPALLNNICKGFIDVDGRNGTSRAATCDGGNSAIATTAAAQQNCVVRPSDIHDIFPIVFFDGNVVPGSAAAAVVLSRGR